MRRNLACLAAVLSIATAACGVSQSPVSQSSSQTVHTSANPAELNKEKQLLIDSIAAVAQKADGTFEDAWFCNRNARVLKSGYARVSPAGKAQFAFDYRKMLEAQGENIALDVNTYVPYKKRAEFALAYWRNSEYAKQFEAEKKKKKIQWIYESMLDAGELFWRAFEILHPELVNSAAVLAHYKEQDMVFNYMEDEKTPGSFSDQYAKWTEEDKAAETK